MGKNILPLSCKGIKLKAAYGKRRSPLHLNSRQEVLILEIEKELNRVNEISSLSTGEDGGRMSTFLTPPEPSE